MSCRRRGLFVEGQRAFGTGPGPALIEDSETAPEAVLEMSVQLTTKDIAWEVLEGQATGDLVTDEHKVKVVVLVLWLWLKALVAGCRDVPDILAATASQTAYKRAVALQEHDVAA